MDHAQNGDTILVIGDALRTGITLQDQLPLTQKGLTIEPGMNGNSSVNLPLKITESYGDNLLSVGFGAQVTLSNLFLTAVDGPSLVNSGILTLSGCTVSDNFVEDGIDNLQGATLTVNDSTVSDNSIGIYNEGTCTVSNSTVSDNGTGIFNGAGTLTVSGSTFYGNTSGGNIFGPYTDEGGNTFS